MNSSYQEIESKAMKYILWNLGSNIRIQGIQKQDDQWKVDLSISFPSEVKNKDGREKTFIYKYDLAKAIYLKENLSINHALTVKADEVEFEILERFWQTNKLIEEAILKFGKNKWGKIPFICTVLSKARTIISIIKKEEKIGIGDLMDTENYEMAKLLVKMKYLRIDRYNSEFLVPTNKLNLLLETELHESTSERTSVFEVVIGELIEEQLDVLLKEFKYGVIKTYIDIVALYYINTVRFGDLITITEEVLLRIFNSFRSRTSTTKKDWNFSRVIDELCIAGLLQKEGKEITGDIGIFTQLMEHKEEIFPPEVSVYEMVTY